MKDISSLTYEDEVENYKGRVIIDFYAPWCNPCKTAMPVMESLSEELKDKVKIVKCNISDDLDLAAGMGVRNVPTFIVVDNGSIVESRYSVGQSVVELAEWVKDVSNKEYSQC